LGGDVDRPVQEVHPQIAPAGGDEGGFVLVPRIEQVAGAGLDHRIQPEAGELPPQRGGLGGNARGEWVEVMVIEGERHAGVSELGDHLHRVTESVVAETVRAVGQVQAHVGETTFAAARSIGVTAVSAAAVPTRPARASRAACSGTIPWIPRLVAERTASAPGLAVASSCCRPTATP